jgi:hypothetical protein
MPDVDIPFSLRLAVLLVALATVAALERWKRGPEATRWREYSFLLGAAVVGAVFGASFDQISLSLSPAYFELGKGIEVGDGFRLRVTTLGAQAGFVAGLILGGMLLMANNPRPGLKGLPYRRLATHVFPVPLAALVLAPFGAVFMYIYSPDLEIAANVLPSFLTVWGLHCGLYLGALVGVVFAVSGVRRERRSARDASAGALEEPAPESAKAEVDCAVDEPIGVQTSVLAEPVGDREQAAGDDRAREAL